MIVRHNGQYSAEHWIKCDCTIRRYASFPIRKFTEYLQAYANSHISIDIKHDGDFCHDLSDPLDHSVNMYPNKAPIFLKGHCLYWHGGGRPLLGVEELLCLGHPRDLSRKKLSDCQLKLLAGNTRSVHFLCCEIALLCLNVDFDAPFEPRVMHRKLMESIPRPLRSRPEEVACGDIGIVTFSAHQHTSPSYIHKTTLMSKKRNRNTGTYPYLSPADMPACTEAYAGQPAKAFCNDEVFEIQDLLDTVGTRCTMSADTKSKKEQKQSIATKPGQNTNIGVFHGGSSVMKKLRLGICRDKYNKYKKHFTYAASDLLSAAAPASLVYGKIISAVKAELDQHAGDAALIGITVVSISQDSALTPIHIDNFLPTGDDEGIAQVYCYGRSTCSEPLKLFVGRTAQHHKTAIVGPLTFNVHGPGGQRFIGASEMLEGNAT